MSREHPILLAGLLLFIVLVLLMLAARKLDFFDNRPDKKIAYKTVDGVPLSLHAFFSKGNPEGLPSPALLLFHGGAWRLGSPKSLYPQCLYFAKQGYHCFSAQYRLDTTDKLDVRFAMEDARSALNYLLENAVKLNIDQDKIAVGGGSAGGHLAATLGLLMPIDNIRPSEAENARPGALVLYNPMLDLSPGKPDHQLVKDYWWEVSPMHHLDNRVPPTLVLLGSEDPEVPVTTAEAFCKAMGEHHRHCELALYQGQSHGFFNERGNDNPYFEITNIRILNFLQDLWD